MVADPVAPSTENKAKKALEKGLNLTYKSNGVTKTTSLKDGLDFVNGDNTVASIEEDGKVKFDLNDATKKALNNVAKGSSNSPFEYAKEDGTSLIKVGDKYYTKDQIGADGKVKPTEEANDYKETDKVVVKAKGNTPQVISNVKSTLPEIADVAGTSSEKPDFTGENASKLNNVATVGDVLNAGWNLVEKKAGVETAKDFVKAYDTIVFSDGTATEVTVENTDGKKSTIKYDVKVDNSTIEVNKEGKLQVKDEFKNQIAKEETVKSENSNILVDSSKTNTTGGKEYKLALSKDLKGLNSIVLGDKEADDVVSISKDKGINAGKKKISNVASGLEGKTLSEIKKEGSKSSQWNNAATIGDLATVQENVNNNTDIIGANPDSTKEILKDKNGNPIKDKSGKQVKATKTQIALTTYDANSQKEVVNNTVVSAIENMNKQGIKFFHTNDGKTKGAGVRENTEDSVASGDFSTGIGFNSHATKTNALAVGTNSRATGENALAVGTGSTAAGTNSIAIGTGNKVNGNNSGAIGDPTVIDSDNSYSVGNNNKLAKGTDNSFVLGNSVEIAENISEVVALGNKTKVTKSGSVALGANSVAGEAHVAKGTVENAYTYAGAADKQVAGKPKKDTKTVSVGKEGEERQVQNVAAGVISKDSTDAVNGSQLYYTNKAVLQNVGNAINNVDQKINSVDDRLQRGIAGTTAMAGIEFMEIGINQATVGAAVGGYRGKHSVAVGIEAAPTVNTRVNAKAAVSPTNKNVDYHYSVGASWRFNIK